LVIVPETGAEEGVPLDGQYVSRELVVEEADP